MGEEEEVGLEIKTVAHKDQEAKAKAQAAATEPPTEAPEKAAISCRASRSCSKKHVVHSFGLGAQ